MHHKSADSPRYTYS